MIGVRVPYRIRLKEHVEVNRFCWWGSYDNSNARKVCTNHFMKQSIGQVTLVVREYDEAIDFYVRKLGFTLVEDTYIPEQDKRWVIVAPPGSTEPRLLLAKAVGEKQSSHIGNQSGGRVFLWRDFHSYKAKDVVFVREPREMSYGTVAVFEDLYGNLWDLLQRKP